ncbi:MAG TPA: MFS transporter [Devosia sp.]|nr:MFS transporter [Devosia sp.]
MAVETSPLAPLREPVFRTLWIANLSSSFGGLIQGVGAAWLMTSIADSVDLVALVQASTSLPIMMFSLFGGAIADSFNRRRVLIGAQVFMLVVSALLVLATYSGMITPWLLLGFTFFIGCGLAINNPSWQASVGDIVPRPLLPSAVALNSIGFNLSRSFGPAVGGAIVAAAGAGMAFAINAVSYIALLVALFLWKPAPKAESPLPREAIGPALLSGVRYVAMSPNIIRVMLRCFMFTVAAISVLALLPVVAARIPGGGPLTYGILLGAYGAGAVGGALLSARLQQTLQTETIVRMAFAGFAVCALTLAFSPWPVLTGLGLAIGGGCWVLALSLFNVSVQLASPRWVVGRALSIYQTAAFGGMALGAWLWGMLAEGVSLQASFLVAAALLLAGVVVGLKLPLPPRSALDLDPLNRWKMPQVEFDVEPRSGPVMIEITYRIRPNNVPAFMRVMTERQRIRRRDGARRWRLMRDLGNASQWIETYEAPTWTEYVRHNMRLTKADANISEQLRALHDSEDPPAVRRLIERPPSWLSAIRSRPHTADLGPH